MEFDEYDYLEKTVEEGKRDSSSTKKSQKGYRRRERSVEEDSSHEEEEHRRSKKSRGEEENGSQRERSIRDAAEKDVERDKDRRRTSRNGDRGSERERLRDRDRERDRGSREKDRERERGSREKDKERERDKRDKEKERERARDRERREKDKEREREMRDREKEKEKEIELHQRSRSRSRSSRRHDSDRERDKEYLRDRETELELRDSRWIKVAFPQIGFDKFSREVLGESKGTGPSSRETWWWREEVQAVVKAKKECFKKWQKDRTEENLKSYRLANKEVKKVVREIKLKVYDDLYTRLDSKEGEKRVYKLAKIRERKTRDFNQVKCIKSEDSKVLVKDDEIKERWKNYFEKLLNEEHGSTTIGEEIISNTINQDYRFYRRIRNFEVEIALKKMKSNKALGPDDIPIEAWKCLGKKGVAWLIRLFSKILLTRNMPDEWRKSILVPIYKNKGDVQNCNNYRGIKLMCHIMKVWERVMERRLRDITEVSENQFGFMPGRSTMEAIYLLRRVIEKYKEKKRDIHMVFIDLEKAYDRVPRDIIWWALEKKGVTKGYIDVIRDMYEGVVTNIRSPAGETNEFPITVGLHQGSTLSPYLFALVMDELTINIQDDVPWCMLFVDDIVLVDETREGVNTKLEIWRKALESKGFRISRTKTEYMECKFSNSNNESRGEVKIENQELPKSEHFRYLGSIITTAGEIDADVVHRIKAGWCKWRSASGVLCDKRIPTRLKGKFYRTAIRPAMLYGTECWATKKQHVDKMSVAEMRMLRWMCGKTRQDRIRNECIWEWVGVAPIEDKLRENRLRWFGHIQRRPIEAVVKRCDAVTVDGSVRGRGRPRLTAARLKEKKEAVEPEADPERDQRTVFAYQMPLKATERDVYEFFSKAGKVRDVRLIMDRNSRRSKGVGYIEFYDAMSVPMAIALSGHLLFGQPVMVKPSEAEKNLVQTNASGGGSVVGSYGAVDRKLYVGNLHFNMTEFQLKQIFEAFGPVELVQLPTDPETGHCKGFGFIQFAQLEHAKAAQSLNGKLEIAGRIIKVSSVTDHVGVQDSGAKAADFDDDDGGGLINSTWLTYGIIPIQSLNAQSRALLMQKLDRSGTATSVAGSLGVPVLNGATSNQQAITLPIDGQSAVLAPALPALVTSLTSEPIGKPSECLLLKNMFDPATETEPDFDLDITEDVQEECSNYGRVKHIYVDNPSWNSAGYVYLRFETVEAAAIAQRAMHNRWFARRLISAVFLSNHMNTTPSLKMQFEEYLSKKELEKSSYYVQTEMDLLT
ncbi:unnamed protein product [Camellia sinensis]